MRVLITGLNSFTGRYVKEELEEAGHEVLGLRSNLVDWKAINNEILAVKPKAVIHLAAISFVPSGNSLDVYSVNTLGTQGLLEALAKLPYDLEKVVLASSSNVYGMQSGKIEEETCQKPINHYGCSKLAMEHMAETYMTALPIVITRPFNYTGVGQSDKFLVPKIVSHYLGKREFIELGNINVARDFSDVRWIAKAYRVLLDNGVAGEYYNLCSGKAVSISSILKKLEQITNHKVEVKVNEKFVRDNDILSQSGNPEKIMKIMKSTLIPDFNQVLEWMALSRS